MSESTKNSRGALLESTPVLRAPDGPWLVGSSTIVHGNSRAMSSEPSVLRSSTTITSAGGYVCAYTASRQARRVFFLL